MGMSDLSMADHLYHYIVGGHKIPLVSDLNPYGRVITCNRILNQKINLSLYKLILICRLCMCHKSSIESNQIMQPGHLK